MKNEVTIRGEIYRKINGNWVDEHYLMPARDMLHEIIRASLEGEAFESLNTEELEIALRDCKMHELFPEASKLALILWERYKKDSSFTELRRLLPIRTSLYRALGKPQEAINFYANATLCFGRALESPAALTSLAAAYCDTGDYETAKKHCDCAYAMQGGAQGYGNELSLVYKRIEKYFNS